MKGLGRRLNSWNCTKGHFILFNTGDPGCICVSIARMAASIFAWHFSKRRGAELLRWQRLHTDCSLCTSYAAYYVSDRMDDLFKHSIH